MTRTILLKYAVILTSVLLLLTTVVTPLLFFYSADEPLFVNSNEDGGCDSTTSYNYYAWVEAYVAKSMEEARATGDTDLMEFNRTSLHKACIDAYLEGHITEALRLRILYLQTFDNLPPEKTAALDRLIRRYNAKNSKPL